MSDETAPSPDKTVPNPADEGTQRVRRISNPRPKKAAKAPQSSKDATDAPVTSPSVESPKSTKFPEFPENADSQNESAPRGDWPEPEAPSSGGAATQSEGAKRKRRRKKGKGGNSQNAGAPSNEEIVPLVAVDAAGPVPSHVSTHAAPHSHPQRPKVDSELLAKRAWKIYLSEVSEEGVALVGDSDAKELSRRCFRLAEIFLEEQARRR